MRRAASACEGDAPGDIDLLHARGVLDGRHQKRRSDDRYGGADDDRADGRRRLARRGGLLFDALYPLRRRPAACRYLQACRGAARRSGAAGLWTDGGLFGGGAAAVDQRGETRQCRYAALLRRGGDPQRRGRGSAAGTRGPPVDKGQLGRQVLFPQPGIDGGALCGWLVRYLRYREV